MKLSLRPGIAIVLGLVWGVQRVYGQSGYTTNPAASAPEVIDGQIFGPGYTPDSSREDQRANSSMKVDNSRFTATEYTVQRRFANRH